MQNSPRKVLCICPIGIGNYLLFYPACVLLKKHDPALQLHLLGLRRSIADLAYADPLWSGITVFDPMSNALCLIFMITKTAIMKI